MSARPTRAPARIESAAHACAWPISCSCTKWRCGGLAARHKLPAVYYERFYATAGGLISYGADRIDLYRQAAGYVDRILKGGSPAELPVQAPSKFELVVNLR